MSPNIESADADRSGLLTLQADEVHIWLTRLDDVSDQFLTGRYLELLPTAERERQQRFVFPHDRKRYLVTRALVRVALSRYVDVRPEDWSFTENAFGRPAIAPSHAASTWLRFNLSHSGDWIAVAVGREMTLGVDLEDMRRQVPLDVARRYFAASELRALSALDAAAQPARFLQLWTLKESYIKARGMGLSIALDRFSFRLESDRIFFTPEPDSDFRPSDWQYVLSMPDCAHLVALCTHYSRAVQIRYLRVVPLVKEARFALTPLLASCGNREQSDAV
jgi:4'-phosphopantetheinyl transferase